MLSENFKEILDNFEVISESKEFKGNSFAGRIRNEFAGEIEEFICSVVCDSEMYNIKGVPGRFDWAKYPSTFPEFRILNYNSASNFENGFYLLYRLDVKRQCVDLILAQGRSVIDEDALIDISDNLVSMIDVPIPKGFNIKFPDKYSPECIMSKCYKYDELDEKVLKSDLEALINIYELLIPKYLKLICTMDLNELIGLIHKSGKNKLKLNGDCEFEKEFLGFNTKQFQSNEKRNKIYFGAPGTGKSFKLNEKKDELLEGYDKNNCERVTFHPDYTYANFVGTYKPVPIDDSISYEYVPGPFMRMLVKALKNPSEPYILIIEEINRANVAAVFGDVFQLLDRDDSNFNSEYPINASEDVKNYLKKELKCIKKDSKELLGDNFDKIKIPSNMFIFATMNSADQGVFPMDTAFKRRWDFKYLNINNNDSEIVNTRVILNNEWIYWNDLRKVINDELLSYGINEDKLIGPFFAFKEYKQQAIDEEIFKEIFKNKIIMYLFEDAARTKRNILFSGAKDKDKNYVTYFEICDKFDDVGIEIFCKSIRDKLLKNSGE